MLASVDSAARPGRRCGGVGRKPDEELHDRSMSSKGDASPRNDISHSTATIATRSLKRRSLSATPQYLYITAQIDQLTASWYSGTAAAPPPMPENSPPGPYPSEGGIVGGFVPPRPIEGQIFASARRPRPVLLHVKRFSAIPLIPPFSQGRRCRSPFWRRGALSPFNFLLLS